MEGGWKTAVHFNSTLVEVVLVASVMSGASGTAEQKYCQSYPNHVMRAEQRF